MQWSGAAPSGTGSANCTRRAGWGEVGGKLASYVQAADQCRSAALSLAIGHRGGALLCLGVRSSSQSGDLTGSGPLGPDCGRGVDDVCGAAARVNQGVTGPGWEGPLAPAGMTRHVMNSACWQKFQRCARRAATRIRLRPPAICMRQDELLFALASGGRRRDNKATVRAFANCTFNSSSDGVLRADGRVRRPKARFVNTRHYGRRRGLLHG